MGSTIGLHGDKLTVDSFSNWGTLFSTFSQADAFFHLLLCWAILGAMIIIFGIAISWFLKMKDVRR